MINKKIDKTLVTLCATATAVLAGSGNAFAADATIVENGKAQYTIVTSPEPNEATKDAVDELNYWVQKISGTKLPVETTEEFKENTPYIAVGSSSLTEKNGWEKSTFKQEEARVFISEDKIGLLGNDNAPYPGISWEGTYYAVLELVKKGFDVKWIWPGESGEVYEQRKTLSVPEGSWNWAPTITAVRSLRNSYSSKKIPDGLKSDLGIDIHKDGGWDHLYEQQGQWLKRERMNKSTNIRFGHAFTKWWDRFSKDHPDWFAKPPGDLKQHGGRGVKLNISNPEVQDQIFKDWKKGWDKNPMANKFINVSPNDSRRFDTRPETRAWDAPEMQHFTDKEIYNGDEPVLSDRYAKLWNILAKRVKEVDPEAKLATYAYRNYQKPPLEVEKMEDNIIVGYVGGEGYYPDERFIRDEWEGWASKGAQLFWRPNLFHAGDAIPYSFSKALYDDFRFFEKNGMVGFDFDTITGNWAGQGLSYYVVAEMSSRPDATYEELSNEYFSAFGPASSSVKEYFAFFEELTQKAPQMLKDNNLVPHNTWGAWRPAHTRLIPLLLTPDVVEHGEKILEQAAQNLQDSDPVYKQRLSVIQRGLEHAKLMAETFRKLNLAKEVKKSYVDDKEILQPLWDYRQNMFDDITVGTARLIRFEEQYFKLWDAFKQKKNANRQLNQENVKFVDLSNGWKFRIDPNNVGVVSKWYTDDRAQNWANIHIGEPWQEALSNKAQSESKVVWYRLSFDMPANPTFDEKVLLHFDAVDSETRMWVNGKYVNERTYPHDGDYDSWREPFSVDISDAVKTAGENELVVRIESENAHHAGITGDVRLIVQQ